MHPITNEKTLSATFCALALCFSATAHTEPEPAAEDETRDTEKSEILQRVEDRLNKQK